MDDFPVITEKVVGDIITELNALVKKGVKLIDVPMICAQHRRLLDEVEDFINTQSTPLQKTYGERAKKFVEINNKAIINQAQLKKDVFEMMEVGKGQSIVPVTIIVDKTTLANSDKVGELAEKQHIKEIGEQNG